MVAHHEHHKAMEWLSSRGCPHREEEEEEEESAHNVAVRGCNRTLAVYIEVIHIDELQCKPECGGQTHL